MSNWPLKVAIAVAILSVHVAVLARIFWIESTAVSSNLATPETAFATAEILQSQDVRDKVPAPEVRLLTPTLSATAPREIVFDDSIEDELAAVVSPASAPRLARVQSVDPGSFARRAHLQPGRPFTVVLRVKVMEDGLVSAADVVRTSDNPAADAAAIGYALELRWVPGTKNQNPETMAVSFPVTLVAPSETSRKSPCKSVRERCTENHG